MAGTRIGGLKASIKNKELHGEDFYSRIGAKGGKLSNTGGFATMKHCSCDEIPTVHIKAECAGKKGGHNGKRR